MCQNGIFWNDNLWTPSKEISCSSVYTSNLRRWELWNDHPREGKRYVRRPCQCFLYFPLKSMVLFHLHHIVTWTHKSNKMFILTWHPLVPLVGKMKDIYTFSSVQFSSIGQSCPTLQPHESQHARPPCPSPTPGIYSHSCPSSQWCYPAISSSVISFSSCSQSLRASGSFLMSQLFSWGGRSIGVSASTAVLPMMAINDSKCCG